MSKICTRPDKKLVLVNLRRVGQGCYTTSTSCITSSVDSAFLAPITICNQDLFNGSEPVVGSANFPVANFIASPTSGEAPLFVQFTDASTKSPTSWSWDFGDGATSNLQNPSHTFQNPNQYLVSLTVSNNSGTSTKYLYINATGSIVLSPTGIPSANAFGTARINYSTTILPTGIASGQAFGTSKINFTINPVTIGDTSGVGIPSVIYNVVLSPTGIPSEESFGSANVLLGVKLLSPTGIPSEEAFGSATVIKQQFINPTGISSAEAFGTSKISIAISAAGNIASGQAFGSATVIKQQFINPTGISSAEAFGSATVLAGVKILSPTGIASAEAFGSATVTGGSTGGNLNFSIPGNSQYVPVI